MSLCKFLDSTVVIGRSRAAVFCHVTQRCVNFCRVFVISSSGLQRTTMYDPSRYKEPTWYMHADRQDINSTALNGDDDVNQSIHIRPGSRRTLDSYVGVEQCAQNFAKPSTKATNGWNSGTDRLSLSGFKSTTPGTASISNGTAAEKASTSRTSPQPANVDGGQRTVSGVTATTRHRHPTSSSFSGNGISPTPALVSKAATNGLRLNLDSRRSIDDPDDGLGTQSTPESDSVGKTSSTSQLNDIIGIDVQTGSSDGAARHSTDGIATTASMSTVSSPGCETPGDEPSFPTSATTRSTTGRYRLVSLADEYFPVTLGGSVEFCTHRDSRTPVTARSGDSSASSAAVEPSPRQLNGRSPGHRHQHHHQHRHRHHHHHHHEGHEINRLNSRRHQHQQPAHRRPGSGQSSSSSRSATSSADIIYGSVAAAVSTSGDVITLNGL